MIADTVEYSYYHSGKRTAAITFSGQTFTGKLSVAVAGGLTGLILTMIGYVQMRRKRKPRSMACSSVLRCYPHWEL